MRSIHRKDFLKLFGYFSVLSLFPRGASCQEKPLPRSHPQEEKKPEIKKIDLPSFIRNCGKEDDLSLVALAMDPKAGYPSKPPFNPSSHYPEYPYSGRAVKAYRSNNRAYALVREALRQFNPKGFGKSAWNPLGKVIKRGDTVLIKPNFVEIESLSLPKTTHPAVIRAVIDYAYKACGPRGKIIVGEGTAASNDFSQIIDSNGMRQTVDYLRKYMRVPVVLLDFNELPKSKAPRVDLGSQSAFSGYGATIFDHHGGNAESWGVRGGYRVASPVLDADVVISVPKVKVHSSAGVTLAMKNMVGIIPSWDGPYPDRSGKDCPHYSSADSGHGKWGLYLGNDTIWRSVADLNKIVLFWRGKIRRKRQRRYLAVGDGIIAGERSMFNPTPKRLGCVLIGEDPIAFDAVGSRVMGFDYRKIKSVAKSSKLGTPPLGACDPRKIVVRSKLDLGEYFGWRKRMIPESEVYSWVGSIEIKGFGKPKISLLKLDRSRDRVSVKASSPNGISFVRLSFKYLGASYFFNLRKTGAGYWSGSVPVGALPKGTCLIISDPLFNETKVNIS